MYIQLSFLLLNNLVIAKQCKTKNISLNSKDVVVDYSLLEQICGLGDDPVPLTVLNILKKLCIPILEKNKYDVHEWIPNPKIYTIK